MCCKDSSVNHEKSVQCIFSVTSTDILHKSQIQPYSYTSSILHNYAILLCSIAIFCTDAHDWVIFASLLLLQFLCLTLTKQRAMTKYSHSYNGWLTEQILGQTITIYSLLKPDLLFYFVTNFSNTIVQVYIIIIWKFLTNYLCMLCFIATTI